MIKMTTLLGVAAVAMAGPARAFDGTVPPAPPAPAAQAPAAAALEAARTKHTEATNAVGPATQADVDAKAKVAELEKVPVTDENKAAHTEQLKAAKTAATAATKALKTANSDVDKAKKAVEKAEKKATEEADKAAKKAQADAEKAAKTQAAEQTKAASKLPEQNGITRPKPDSQTGKAWAIFDQVSNKNGAPASIGETLPMATAQGINEATCRTQYARWRKFNGVAGRVDAPKPVAPEVPAAPVEGAVPPAPPAPVAAPAA